MKYRKTSKISVRIALHHSVLEYLLLLPEKSVQFSEKGRVGFDVLVRKLINLVSADARRNDLEAG